MRSALRLFLVTCLLGAVAGCEDLDREESGGVVIAYGNLTGFPDIVSVNNELADGELSLGVVQLRSIISDPDGPSSDLMDIRIESYEVRYSRGDGGTRLPPPLVRFYTGSLPANGIFNAGGVVILWEDQVFVPPINDLFFDNGGIDRETGRSSIILNYHLRFFGRTVAGREVQSPVLNETIELVL